MPDWLNIETEDDSDVEIEIGKEFVQPANRLQWSVFGYGDTPGEATAWLTRNEVERVRDHLNKVLEER